MELRVRHANEPAKFRKSEAALHLAIGELTRVAENPDFYATLRAANAPESLLALFSHENVDVTMAVVKLLSELIDGDVIAGHEGALQFTRELLVPPHNLISMLVAFLPRLQESQDVGGEYEEDSKSVYHVLEMFENLADMFPELCAQACEQTGVLEWLTHRACASAFDGNAMYASEILSIFLQPIPSYKGTPATAWMCQGARIRTLIHRVAGYRKQDPGSGEEKEYVANLFMSLCSTLLDQKTNQDVFSAEKGVDLMLVLMRKRVYARVAAFKVLDYATQNNAANCESFVDMGGLKLLFSAFMGNTLKKSESKHEAEFEERSVGMILTLILSLSDVRYMRVLRKFQEKDLEKVDRLLELYVEARDAVSPAERLWLEQNDEETVEGLDDEDASELYFHLLFETSLSGRLSQLQNCGLLIGLLCSAGDGAIKAHVNKLLLQNRVPLASVKRRLHQYALYLQESIAIAEKELVEAKETVANGHKKRKKSSSSSSSSSHSSSSSSSSSSTSSSSSSAAASPDAAATTVLAKSKMLLGVISHIHTLKND
jgi:beta-catenin-like protein 1